jgi:hypothetical protein
MALEDPHALIRFAHDLGYDIGITSDRPNRLLHRLYKYADGFRDV